jgi:hypothetical protein
MHPYHGMETVTVIADSSHELRVNVVNLNFVQTVKLVPRQIAVRVLVLREADDVAWKWWCSCVSFDCSDMCSPFLFVL